MQGRICNKNYLNYSILLHLKCTVLCACHLHKMWKQKMWKLFVVLFAARAAINVAEVLSGPLPD